MGKTIMGAIVSLDGFMADDNDGVGPLFDWLGNGDVAWSFPGSDGESRSTQASADFMRSHYRNMATVVIGRRPFDMTNDTGFTGPAGDSMGRGWGFVMTVLALLAYAVAIVLLWNWSKPADGAAPAKVATTKQPLAEAPPPPPAREPTFADAIALDACARRRWPSRSA